MLEGSYTRKPPEVSAYPTKGCMSGTQEIVFDPELFHNTPLELLKIIGEFGPLMVSLLLGAKAGFVDWTEAMHIAPFIENVRIGANENNS